MLQHPRYDESKEWESNLNKIRVEEGFTIKRLSDKVGSNAGAIGLLANGMMSPIAASTTSGRFKGDIKYVVERLCDVLKCTPADLFPRYICDIRRNVPHLEPFQILDITCGDYTHKNNFTEKIIILKILNNILSTLRPREEAIVRKYYYDGFTFKEIGEYFGLTVERTRQILLKALRKIRHPTHWRRLRDYATPNTT